LEALYLEYHCRHTSTEEREAAIAREKQASELRDAERLQALSGRSAKTPAKYSQKEPQTSEDDEAEESGEATEPNNADHSYDEIES